jgi:hypothetical protein
LPRLAHEYGLLPWEVAGGDPWLSFAEVEEFTRQINEADRKARQEQRRSGRWQRGR